jgi:hypothetical protein
VRTWFTGDWFTGDDQPDPAFEGYFLRAWNGWAEWMTNRRVIEQIAVLTAASPYGETLVVTSPEYPETPSRIEPDAEGLYDIGLGMTWTRYDHWDRALDEHEPRVSMDEPNPDVEAQVAAFASQIGAIDAEERVTVEWGVPTGVVLRGRQMLLTRRYTAPVSVVAQVQALLDPFLHP